MQRKKKQRPKPNQTLQKLPTLPPITTKVSGGADLFIGFGGVVARPPVAAAADWFVTGYAELSAALRRYRVGARGL
jgi:hypothetical protein